MDPLFEKTMTPYQYTYQNPIKFIDPTGMSAEGWIVQDGENGGTINTYRADINTVAEAEAAGFKNVREVSESRSITNDSYGYRYDLNSDGTYTFSNLLGSATGSVYDTNTFTTQGGSTIMGYKCSMCASIGPAMSTNSIYYQMGNPSGQLSVAAYYGIQTFGGVVAGEAVLGAVGLGGGVSLSGYAAAGDALGGLGVQTSFSSVPIITNSPRFLVSPAGVAFPVPLSAEGPIPVVNHNGITTGRAFVNGVGGASGDASTIRIMNPNKRFPTGYIKYENSLQQGVNPYTGKTVSNAASHIPL